MLSMSQRFESLRELERHVMSLYFGIPSLLNIEFADPPYVERVDGTVGASTFRWELSEWSMDVRSTSQEIQAKSIVTAWQRLEVLAGSHRRRLAAGLHYFHLACRLAREGCTPGEFTAEVILNLAKLLEVLFPPTSNEGSRDAIRARLEFLGFTAKEIEGDFLPAIALRNEIDVGHVQLGLFTIDQRKVIHAYVERAENRFREMVGRLFTAIEGGTWDVTAYESNSPRIEAVELVERLRRHTSD
jgi:hypothetical protein